MNWRLTGLLLALALWPRFAAAAPPEQLTAERRSAGPAPERDRLGWAVPDYARLQTGGFLGLATAVLGYSALRDSLNFQLSYGFVPAWSKETSVHLGSALLLVRPIRIGFGARERFWLYPIYAGTGVMVASAKGLFVRQPDVYPAGYYPPNALHALGVLGIEFAFRPDAGQGFTRHALFIEAVTIDQYLDAINQNRSMSPFAAFSTAIGYKLGI